MIDKQGFTYIMSNQYRTTFYIGVTNDLRLRVEQHIDGSASQFVKKYRCFDLIYFERHMRITDAIDREKQLKNWHKEWKINLIRSVNPTMKDLKEEIDY
jgi:putative endonuclease